MAKREKLRQFLPVNKQEMLDRDWYWYDILFITADAYVDHPTFGAAVISRVLEDAGFRVCMLAQPNWRTIDDLIQFGKPKLGGIYLRWKSGLHGGPLYISEKKAQ